MPEYPDREATFYYFDLVRRATAFKTAQGWVRSPHVVIQLEPRADRILALVKALRSRGPVTINAVMLKLIAEALKKSPELNAHIFFNNQTCAGHATTYERIDIAVPMVSEDGRMVAPVVRDVGRQNILEVSAQVASLRQRLTATDLDALMLDTARKDARAQLKRGRFGVLYRYVANHVGKNKLNLPSMERRARYAAMPPEQRLTPSDLQPATIVVTNIGSALQDLPARVALIEVIPPMTAAIGLSAIRKQPVVIVNEHGEDSVGVREILPLVICFDHRMTDFVPIKGFLTEIAALCEAPERLIEELPVKTGM